MSSMSKEIGNKLFLSESKYSDKWLNSYRETEFPVPHKDSNQRSKNTPRYTTSPLGRTTKYFFKIYFGANSLISRKRKEEI